VKVKFSDQVLNQVVSVTGAPGGFLTEQTAMELPDLAVGDAVIIKRVTVSLDESGQAPQEDTGG